MDGEHRNRFDPGEYGAVGDGTTQDAAAVQRAIDACSEAGGGMVYCAPGDYLIGTIELKSGVNLHIEAGATLRGSTRKQDYLPLELSDLASESIPNEHLIFARRAQNIAITGRGTINGNGRAFFGSVRPGETHMSVRDWRPGHMLAFVECRDVLVRDVRLLDSPLYTIWPLGCERVTIQGVTIINERQGPNTDGIDPDCCRDVIISDCFIDAGDDCIALKSHSALLGRDAACENVVVTNCILSTTCCAVRVGYEGDGPIRNCTFSNLVMPNTRTGINILVPRHAEIGIQHGPAIENIRFSNIVMDTKIALYLWIGDDASPPGGIRNVSITDLTATTERACYIGGSTSVPVEGVRLDNFDLTVHGATDDEFADTVPYPYPVFDYWNKQGIPHGLYARYVRDLSMRDVRVRWGEVAGPWRSALRCDSVAHLQIDALEASNAPGPENAAAVHLTNVHDAVLRGCRAEPGTGTFLLLDGPRTRDVTLLGGDFHHARMSVRTTDDVPGSAILQGANRQP